MKKILLIVVACFLLAGISFQINAGSACCPSTTIETKDENSLWLTDFEKAKKLAKEKNLPILIDFSGSDWCGWCIKLEEEVFDKDQFKAWAKENVILFMADFPRRKAQSEKIKKQNQKLAQQYGVRGFPTVLILDKDAKKIGQTGYKAGGAIKYIEHLKEIISK